MPIHHLTLTGPAAGQPYCGIDKARAADAGHTFSHMPYDARGIAIVLARADLCPICKAEWDAAGEPEEGVPDA